MTLSDIVQLISIKLGSQTLFYSAEEITRSGINPAQRLLCLRYPHLLFQRTTHTVGADLPFIDLREVLDSTGVRMGNRIQRVRRVMLGTISGDTVTRNAATGEFLELRRTTLRGLSSTNQWLQHRGTIRHYWIHSRYWMGLYKRPIAETTITIIFEAMPVALVNDADVPQVQEAWHRAIADIAMGLLIVKEGNPQAALGLARVLEALNMPRQGAA